MKNLIKKAQQGDKQAFSQLMQQHMQAMYKTAWAYLGNDEDAADVIQETILVCYEKLGTLRHPRYFKTWLTRILINKCKDFLKNRSRQTPTEIFAEPSYEENGFCDCEWKEILSCLDEKYRSVLVLYYGQDMRIKEIAALLDINENTVMTRLSRARQKLRQEYEGGVIYGR